MLKILKIFFSLFFTQSVEVDTATEHMTFLRSLLSKKVDEATLQLMVNDFLSNQPDNISANLVDMVETFMEDATIQGDQSKQEILDKVKNFIK